ncbi:MAG: radical SAM family heme chaperone HemW [Coriobacteriia bacterium]|nr:radical SAM family heme chaperone HemW [Coriobacteriia bacterium]
MAKATQRDLALYIHVPFCQSRCSYCDFYSTSGHECADQMMDAYCDVLCAQIVQWGSGDFIRVGDDDANCTFSDMPVNAPVTSIYIGGGTPTLLGARLCALLDAITQNFTLADDCEITVEANPESFDAQLATQLATAGMTRISLGIQSLDDDILCLLGRVHSAKDAMCALRAAAGAGLRVSADFIFGLPRADGGDDSIETVLAGIQAVLPYVGHVSVYPLTVEDGTALSQQVGAGTIYLPGQDIAADELVRIEDYLRAQGFTRYEISSYAVPGQESRQNMRYWTCAAMRGDYLGLGPSAASMINHEDGSRSRFVLHDSIESYLQGTDRVFVDVEKADSSDARREDIMLALRTRRGATISAAKMAGVQEICESLSRQNLLRCNDTHYRCTSKGWLLGNEVFSQIL